MSIETDYATLRSVIHEYNPKGWAAEFGVYSGYSLNIIAAHMPVIGFDSFEGLPEDWREGFAKGAFATGFSHDANPNLCGTNRMIVPGWFEDTVPTFPFPPLGLVHIDCDLYSSTVTALEAVTLYVDIGTILVFDEYHSYPGAEEHEEKAFNEWRAKHGVTVEFLTRGCGKYGQESSFRIMDIAGIGWAEV